jgi:hypothetical protein
VTPNITFESVKLATRTMDDEGLLVLVAGRLAAVLSRLRDEFHEEEWRGAWFVEAAFGMPFEAGTTPVFRTLDEAAFWFGRRGEPADADTMSPSV